MQCYTELTPPTAVTNSLALPFFSAKANNLIVAKSSLLQIFELRSIITEAEARTEAAPAAQDGAIDPEKSFLGGGIQRTETTSKLVLVTEYALSGTVTALQRVKTLNTRSGGEALLVSFRDAKLSLLEWDPEYHTISTISIHYYEGEDVQESPIAPDLSDCVTHLTVDPGSRCAALKFGQRHLAILPFRQLDDDLAEDDFDPDLDDPADRPQGRDVKMTDGEEGHQTPYGASFVLSLTAIDISLTHPLDLAFLHEYREPTFGILSSTKYSSAALLSERKDILSYTVFTLDLEQKASTTLLSVTGIPFDIHRIVPLPLPVGGALLVGNNELIHIDQAGKSTAIAVNEFARQCSSFPMVDQGHLKLRLEGCQIDQLGVDTGDILLVLASGELAVLSFDIDGRSVSALSVTKVSPDRGGSLLIKGATCVSSLGRGRVFLGCEDSDSLLLGWTRKSSGALSRKRSYADMTIEDADSSEEEIMDDIDDDLYGSATTGVKQVAVSKSDSTPGQLTFRVHDHLPNLAPLRDLTLGKPYKKSKSEEETSEQSLEIVASIGREKTGGIAIIKRELALTEISNYDLSSVQAMWSIHALKADAQGEDGLEAQLSADAQNDYYLLVSEEEESRVYAITEGNIEEVTKGDFEGDAGATIDVGVLAGGTRIVQVLQGEVRGYDAGKCKSPYFLLFCQLSYTLQTPLSQKSTDARRLDTCRDALPSRPAGCEAPRTDSCRINTITSHDQWHVCSLCFCA